MPKTIVQRYECRLGALKRNGYQGTTDEECFWENVKRGSLTECWPWMGPASRKYKYGTWNFFSRKIPAHRQAFEYANGPFDKTLDVCHHCDNPICCNPNHLFLGTALDNMQDCISKGRFARAKGERHGNAVLTEDLVRAIRKDWAEGKSVREIALERTLGKSNVAHVVKRRAWLHVVDHISVPIR